MLVLWGPLWWFLGRGHAGKTRGGRKREWNSKGRRESGKKIAEKGARSSQVPVARKMKRLAWLCRQRMGVMRYILERH